MLYKNTDASISGGSIASGSVVKNSWLIVKPIWASYAVYGAICRITYHAVRNIRIMWMINFHGKMLYLTYLSIGPSIRLSLKAYFFLFNGLILSCLRLSLVISPAKSELFSFLFFWLEIVAEFTY